MNELLLYTVCLSLAFVGFRLGRMQRQIDLLTEYLRKQ